MVEHVPEDIAVQAIDTIADGVFFVVPEALPRGRHSISRDAIADAQRERVLMAMTELIAAKGYPSVSISDVVARAQVSRAVFYQFFSDKQICALVAYDRFIAVLLGEVTGALGSGGDRLEDVVDGCLRAYLGPIRADPVVGRAFQVEIDAMGVAARRRRRESLLLFADALRHEHIRLHAIGTAGRPLPRSAYLAAVYAVRQMASDLIDAGSADRLFDEIPDMTTWVLRLLGHD